MNSLNKELINHLINAGVLKSDKIKTALRKFPREKFVPPALADAAYEDHPLPIGQGQTISQPYTVVCMLELLDAQAGDNVLEIGAGSAWQTALLSSIVDGGGSVWAYEINETVGKFGLKNLSQFSLANVDYAIADASEHWHAHAPYNRIIAGAAFDEIPAELKNLLSPSGRLVAPTQENDIRVIERRGDNFQEEIYSGFIFVPIVHDD